MAPAHSHDHYEETIYGIEGVLTWTVDGRLIDLGPGQALCIPRGAVHRFDNNGTEDVKGAVRHYARRNRPAVFPRSGGSGQRGGRWPAGSREDGGDHAPPRADSGSSSASGVGLRRVQANDCGHSRINADDSSEVGL